MITLNMQQKNSEIKITETMFDVENNILTLQISVVDGESVYDLTGKIITASFSPAGKESEILSVTDGLIQLPIYSSYVKGGQNIFHLIFRWNTDKVEMSPAIIWIIKSTNKTSGIAQENVDIVTSLIAQLNTAIANVGEITVGARGDSAYEVAVTNGFVGTEIEWLASLKGIKGDSFAYTDFTTEQLATLKGDKGDAFLYSDFTSEQLTALKGVKGDAFTYADFTQAQLDALKVQGDNGLSAYQIWLNNTHIGTEADFLASLEGTDGYTPVKGVDYNDGTPGYTPIKGVDYNDGAPGYAPVKGVDYFDGAPGVTPIKGTDYYTSAEIAQTKSDIEADLSAITIVTAVSNVYAIDFANKPSINIAIATADAVAKTVTVANVPTRTEMYLELVYTNAAAITWFSGITWLGGTAPTLTAGKSYRLAFFTINSGTAWHGVSVGGW